MKKNISHPFKPVYDKNSKVLLLGSIASTKSRELGYPYASPTNRFWPIMEALFNDKVDDYKIFLLRHHVALWDVIKTCEIVGSSDASIKNVEVNEIWEVIENSQIKAVFTNGKKAYEIYQKFVFPKTNIPAISLPSTSPANASKRINDLINDYKIILTYL